MSDLDVLRDLAGQVQPPAYADLVTVARRRRRRSTVGAAAVAATTVVVVTAVAAGVADRRGAEPAPVAPTPSETESPGAMPSDTPDPTLSAKVTSQLRAIRDHGTLAPDSDVTLRDRGTGLGARLFYGCEGRSCTYVGYDAPPGTPRALEVTQDGRSALFDVAAVPATIDGDNGQDDVIRGVLITVFDQDSVLVQDVEQIGSEPRFRLLQADGTSFTLRKLPGNPAPARLTADVRVVEDASASFDFVGHPDDLSVIDARAGTIRPLDVPDERIHTWAAYGDLVLGTGEGCRVAWLTPDGLQQRRLDCADAGPLFPLGSDLSEGWMHPGRMAVIELDRHHTALANDDALVVHASLDQGATWQQIPAGPGDGDWTGQIADALRRLG